MQRVGTGPRREGLGFPEDGPPAALPGEVGSHATVGRRSRGEGSFLFTLGRTVFLLSFLLSVTAGAEPARGRGQQRLHPGKTALRSSLVQADGSPPVCSDKSGPIPCAVEIRYFGGQVLPNVKVYAVLWDATVSTDVAQGIGDFYRAFTSSEVLDWLAEYSTTLQIEEGSHAGGTGTHQVIGRGTFAGTVRLPSLSQTYPSCTGEPALTCVSDMQIASELEAQVTRGALPAPDVDTLYVVHTPPAVRVTFGGTSGVSCRDFCAYHNTVAGTRTLTYAVIPDLGSNGCENGCGRGTVFQNTCESASHEIAEAITDAEVGLVHSDNPDYPLGWYDFSSPSQGEIADMCEGNTDTIGSDGLVGCAAGTPGCFTVQQVFSRMIWNADPGGHPETAACVAARYQPSGDFTLAFSPNTLTLAAGETSAPIPVLTTVTQTAPGGAPLAVTLSASTVPPGLHVAFDSSSIDVGQPARLTVSADANASLQTDAVLAVQATGTVTHSASILVQVIAPPNDWALSIAPATASLAPGGTVTFTVSGQVTSGQPETVALSPIVAGLPPGVLSNFDRTSLTPGSTTSKVTLLATSSAAAVGPTTFTITGTSAAQLGGHGASAQVQVDVPTKAPGGCSSGGREPAAAALLLLAGLVLRRRRRTGWSGA